MYTYTQPHTDPRKWPLETEHSLLRGRDKEYGYMDCTAHPPTFSWPLEHSFIPVWVPPLKTRKQRKIITQTHEIGKLKKYWFLLLQQLLMLFSHSVVSNSLQPHGLQHSRLSCPSPSPGVCLNSYPLNQWCHSTILFSFIPFFSCLQSFQWVSFSHQVTKVLELQFLLCYFILFLWIFSVYNPE